MTAQLAVSEKVALRAMNISKTYGTNQVLTDVSVAVKRGHIHALVGGNGCGKSTFIKILAGVVDADAGGTVVTDADTVDVEALSPQLARESGLRFVHQDPGLFLALSVAENLAIGEGFPHRRFGGIKWDELHEKAARVLRRFHLDVDSRTPMIDLRPAERTMVAIARALQDQDESDDGILILDEPTASLAIAEVEVLLAALRSYAERGQTIIIVSHRLSEVIAIADEITVLRDGHHVVTRPTAGLDTASLAELIVGRRTALTRSGDETVSDEVVLEAAGMAGGPIRDVSLTLHRGEVVGVAGLVGSGRTTLMRMLSGSSVPAAGEVTLNGQRITPTTPRQGIQAGIAYLPEDRGRDAAFPELPLSQNISASDITRYWRKGRLSKRQEDEDARATIGEFGIVADTPEQLFTTLSGGNQQKAIVARVMRTNPDVLLLDEPSQGVDVGARVDIHRIIREYVAQGAAALVTSSDLEELAQVCDRVLVLVDGRIAAERRSPDIDPAELASLTEGAG